MAKPATPSPVRVKVIFGGAGRLDWRNIPADHGAMEKDNASMATNIRENLLNALYDSLSVPGFPSWMTFLETARQAFACDHATIIVASFHLPHKQAVMFYDAPGIEPTIEELCGSDFFDALRDQSFVEGECLAAADGHPLRRVLMMAVPNESSRTVCLALWRTRALPFNDAEQALFKSLFEPMKRAVKLFFQLADLWRNQTVLNVTAETAGIGVILVDADANVKLTNSVAKAVLAEGDGLKLSGGKLRGNSAAETTMLMEQIRQRAAEQQAESDRRIYTPLALPRLNKALPLTVIIRPGPAFGPLQYPIMRAAMLVLRDPEQRPLLPAATLTRLFGLTKAESMLASELARGSSLEEAALHLGITLHTARSQLRAVFIKTGAKRQGELVGLLLSSAATLSA